MKYNLVKVESKPDKQAFLNVVDGIYQSDANYIRPLDKDIEEVFDKSKNKSFKDGDASRWILKSGSETVGRVAAFYNKRKAKKGDVYAGGMGFFECINDYKAAEILFDTCKDWLTVRDFEAMDGPINFGQKDRWWGLLVDGFLPPTYLMNYNPPYYQSFFEKYGFKVYFEQYTYSRKIDTPVQEVYQEKADVISKDENYSFHHIKKKDLYKWGEYFRKVYNRAWGGHADFKELREEQARSIMKTLKPIVVEDLMWFGFYKNEPVSFFIMLPELNQIFKRFKGKFGMLEKLRFLYHMKTGTVRKAFGLVFGVDPDHQGKGVEGAMIIAAAEHIQPQNRWDDLEMTWIGDFNPKMLKVVQNLGAERVKTYYTYRKLFDENMKFERLKKIEDNG